MSAHTKLTYDYLQGGTKDRKLVLGTISCRLYGSKQSFDDRGAKLPLHQIKQSSDAKTGVTTISAFVQSDLTYFEPQVAWEDRTADKSASSWPVDNKAESLCLSIYCDGETKKPVVEYPILSHDFDAIDIEFTDGKTRQPFIFKERTRTVKHFVAKDAVLAKSGQTVDDLSSIVIVIGHCELSEVVDGSSAPRNRAGCEWLGNSAKYQHDNLTHEVDLGEAEPLPPQELPIYHKRSLLRVKRVTPLVRFVFYYKRAKVSTSQLYPTQTLTIILIPDVLTKLGIIAAPTAGNRARDTGELPVLTAAEFLEKLAAVPAMYKGKDVKSFAETCRNASKAVTLLAVSFDDEDWQTFEVLRSKQASIEEFTKKWPSQTQLRTFLSQAQSLKEAENAYRALLILTERLIKLKNTPLSTAQHNYCSFYGQFKLTGQGLQSSSFEALKELNIGALTTHTSASKTLGKRRASFSKASVAKKGKSTQTSSTRHAVTVNMDNDSSDDSLVVKASLISAKPKSARGAGSGKTSTAATAASMKRVSSHVQTGGKQGQGSSKGKESKQHRRPGQVQAPAFAQANGAPPTPAASTSGSHVRDASPEDVKPQVVDLTNEVPDTSIAVALSAALGGRQLKPEVLDVFVQAGFEPDISLSEFKQDLRRCNGTVKQEFYGKLKEVMPLLRFGIFLNRLEGIE